MAVTLISDDLVQPTGELSDALFPDGDIGELVSGWLRDAKSKAATLDESIQNLAATAYIYMRGYSHVVQRLSVKPGNLIAGPRTEEYSADQRKYFADLVDYYLNQCYGYGIIPFVQLIPEKKFAAKFQAF